MRAPSWLRRRGLDAAYLGTALFSLVQFPVETLLEAATVGFAVVVLLTDWIELQVALSERHRNGVRLAATTLPVLALWVGLPLVADSNLRLYFALAGGVFFVQASRDVVLFERSPIELLRYGYPNLIGVCLVCSLLAAPLIQYRATLFALVGFTFVVRKAFVWNGLFDAA